jgi:hypothetical protein
MHDAYFAGLMDGEAYIGLPSKGRSGIKRPTVRVNMTCEKTVRLLHQRLGGRFATRKVPKGNKPQWEWRCTCGQAANALRAVRPYLITKADAADEILQLFAP